MATYASLPLEILYTIKTFATNTRIDWRTCKRREAALIRSLEGHSALEYLLDQDLLDWTLYGRLFMSETLAEFPAFASPSPLGTPPPMEDFRRWYLLQYGWLNYKGEQVNLWV